VVVALVVCFLQRLHCLLEFHTQSLLALVALLFLLGQHHLLGQ
jgi:hypothetical protein